MNSRNAAEENAAARDSTKSPGPDSCAEDEVKADRAVRPGECALCGGCEITGSCLLDE